jgi:starvation-inducible DNA-binding protein
MASKNSDSSAINDLRSVLSDTFVLYFKTHSFHWNVEGPHFHSLHLMFEEQYNDLWKATDEIAERLRALGGYAANNLDEMKKGTRIDEVGQTPDANSMVGMLAEDNQALADTMKTLARKFQDNGDDATSDMLIQRIETHEKFAWMLRSTAKAA